MSAADRLAQLISFARLVEPTLSERSYYELLNVDKQANIPTIRRAFYDVAAKLHPDRCAALDDAEARSKLETIYARIAEGYRVLSEPQKRAAYDEALGRGHKRLVITARDKKGPQNPEELLKHPEAKKFFRLGMIALANRDFKGAALNFNFARSFEPSAAVIAEKLAEAKAGAEPPAG
ncbi:MAG: DnaJ domain-containing protein [Myxococcales bacterium]|nr:DnaJ domain-containing protein [Myxococcales bacterium]